jgi:hypothetical protein
MAKSRQQTNISSVVKAMAVRKTGRVARLSRVRIPDLPPFFGLGPINNRVEWLSGQVSRSL